MKGWFPWQPVDPAPLGPADQLCDSSTGLEYNHPVHLSQEGDQMQPFLLQANDGNRSIIITIIIIIIMS